MTKTTSYDSLLAKKAAIEEEMRPLQRQRHADLRAKRDEIEAKLAPLYAELEATDSKKREAELRQQIVALKAPMAEVDRELSALTRELADPKTGIAKTGE